MDEKSIHELAVAFAQVKLKEYQLERRVENNQQSNSESSDDEVRYYAKMYKLIIDRFQIEYDDLD